MRRLNASTTRRLLLWLFDEPSNDPYISLTFDVDLAPARAFLGAFEREHGERVSVQHLVTKAVARCLAELPALNVKILNRSLYQLERVDIAVPVHLGGGARGDETGMTIVHHVDKKSLLEVARETRRGARAERDGELAASGSAFARRLSRWAPDALMRAGLDATRALLVRPTTYRLLEPWVGVSSAVTNVGAVFALPKGARVRAGSAHAPAKLGHVASIFGVAPAEDDAAVEDGEIVARKVLPVLMVVDHRAVDGFLMATAASRVAEALLDPSWLGA